MPFPPLNPALGRALLAREYAEPTTVQSAVLVPDADGRDLLVSAQTGSGKTVAYGAAFASTLLGDAEQFGRAGAPLALVVAPTRELAMQVRGELAWLYQQTGARLATCVGGMDSRAEQRVLAAGCHIVVGTPGRLRDHIERGRLDLGSLRCVVLDEADEMLDLGFREDLEFILDRTPPERRTLLFSATIAREIASLAKRFQRDALRIDVGGNREPHRDIEYRAVTMAPHDAERACVNVLRYFEARAALVFCATREGVRRLHGRLMERGFDAVALSGELSQHERTGALQSLRDGRSRVCVATDVAARGLDLPDLDLVIHADLPTNKETMLHRSGRTGRAGRKGTSVLLVPYSKRRRAEQLLTAASVDAGWSDPPSAELIRGRDQERLLADPILAEEPNEEDLVLARTLLEGRPAEWIAAALVRTHRARLPSPEAEFDPAPVQTRQDPTARFVRAPREPQRTMTGGAWFRVTVGRRSNADPKWLIPLICRLGHVTKADIGAIRIFDTDTRFEITADAAERFAAAVAHAGEGEARIEPSTAGAEARTSGARPGRSFVSRKAPRAARG